MVFTNVYNPRSAVTRKDDYRDTLVKVWGDDWCQRHHRL
jgi:hypothetical protein